MATQIGPRIGIDGEKQYRDQIQQLIQQGKTLDAQMRAVSSSFESEADAQAAAGKQAELLEQRLKAQREQVAALAEMVERSTEATGENSTATLKWKEALANAETALHQLEGTASGTDDQVEGLNDSMESAGGSAMTLGDYIKGNLAAEMVISGVQALATAMKELGKALLDVVKDSAAYADDILALSTNTGLSTDTLQEFQYMAGLTDTSLDTITGSLTKLTKQMSSAKSGTGAAADAFKTLGVRITDENGSLRDNEQVFYEIIDALGQVENVTERDALSMDIFGKSAQDLNSLIATGSDGIAAYAQEARDMGYVLDSEALGSLGAVDDGFQRMDKAVTAAKNRLGVALAPVVTELADKLLEMAQSVDWEALGEKISGAVDGLMNVLGWIIDNGDTIIAILAGIGTGLLVFQVASTVLELAAAMHEFMMADQGASVAQALLNAVIGANPIVLIIGLIAGLVAAIVTLWTTNEDFRNWLINAWEGIKEFFTGLIEGAWNWGRDLVQGFIDGIKAKWEAIKSTVSDLAQTVADYLHFSEPDKGPLADFGESGKDMMELYARGINANAWRVEDAVAGLATDVYTELPGRDPGNSYNYGGISVNVYPAEGQDSESIADAVMDRIQDAVSQKEAVFA